MRIDSAPGIINGDRTALVAAAFVRDSALAPLDVLLETLTETDAGFSATAPSPTPAEALPIGTMVKVRIPGVGNPLAQVETADGRSIAVTFAEPISPRAVARALATAATAGTVIIPQMAVDRRIAAAAPDGIARSPSSPEAGAPPPERAGQSLILSAEALARFAATTATDIPPIDAAPEEPDARALASLLAVTNRPAPQEKAAIGGLWWLWGAILAIGLLYLLA